MRISVTLESEIRLALAALALVASGCATTGNDQVRVTRNPEATVGCKFVQNVEATGSGGIEHMEKKLRDEAAKVGADLVYLPPRPERGFTVYGEAYKCPSSTPAPAPTPRP